MSAKIVGRISLPKNVRGVPYCPACLSWVVNTGNKYCDRCAKVEEERARNKSKEIEICWRQQNPWLNVGK